MAEYDKTALKSRIDTLIPDNTTQQITPAVVRGLLKDMVDSLRPQTNYVVFDSKSGNFSLTDNQLEATINVNASATITLPDGFEEGWWCIVTNVGTGQINWSATNPVQSDGSINNTRYTSFQVLHIGGNIWRIEGRTN